MGLNAVLTFIMVGCYFYHDENTPSLNQKFFLTSTKQRNFGIVKPQTVYAGKSKNFIYRAE